jgi:hypothetical protein
MITMIALILTIGDINPTMININHQLYHLHHQYPHHHCRKQENSQMYRLKTSALYFTTTDT